MMQEVIVIDRTDVLPALRDLPPWYTKKVPSFGESDNPKAMQELKDVLLGYSNPGHIRGFHYGCIFVDIVPKGREPVVQFLHSNGYDLLEDPAIEVSVRRDKALRHIMVLGRNGRRFERKIN